MGSAVTAGKMSKRVGRRCISLLVEEEILRGARVLFTAGKMSSRVGRRCSMVLTLQGLAMVLAMVVKSSTRMVAMVVTMVVKSSAMVLTMVKSIARMVDLSPVQPGVPSSITSGDSPPLMRKHI